MLDVHPHAVAEILGGSLPRRTAEAFRRFRPGRGLQGGVRRRGRRAVASGRDRPRRHRAPGGVGARDRGRRARRRRGADAGTPFVLVGQQHVADPQRSVGTFTRCTRTPTCPPDTRGRHRRRRLADRAVRAGIPRSHPGDPGDHRDGVEPAEPELCRGDILTGAKTPLQFMLGPRISAQPYDTGVPASTSVPLRRRRGRESTGCAA